MSDQLYAPSISSRGTTPDAYRIRLGGHLVDLDDWRRDNLFLLPGVRTFFLGCSARSLVSKLNVRSSLTYIVRRSVSVLSTYQYHFR